MPEVPEIRLNDGRSMPQLGLGVFEVPDDEVAEVVLTAFAQGYRSVDTAAGYRNERGVGAAIAASGIPREELFVTTKLANWDHRTADSAVAALETSLDELGLDHVDLYLVHWPIPARDAYVETWRAFEALRADGRARSIGVSNFAVAHLERLLAETGTVPAVNQIELHPQLQQEELRAFGAAHGIVTEAWSPIAKGAILDHPVVAEIAERSGRTPAQVVLRWHLQLGNVVIPKSATPSRIAENIAVFDFALAEEDMARIAELDAGVRIGPDPDTFDA